MRLVATLLLLLAAAPPLIACHDREGQAPQRTDAPEAGPAWTRALAPWHLSTAEGDLSHELLAAARAYPLSQGYCWSGAGCRGATTGVSHDLRFALRDGAQWTVPRDRRGTTYCSGFMLMAAHRVIGEHDLFAHLDREDAKRFQRMWYMRRDHGSRYTDEDVRQAGIILALEDSGIGMEIPAEHGRPGDIVQLWRDNGSGHSAVLVSWIAHQGERIGLRYLSSQRSTEGVGERVECMADHSLACPAVCDGGCAVTTLRLGRMWAP